MAKQKLIFNPFIKGNFDYIKDYDGDLDALQNEVNHGQTINSETIERVDSIESIISMLQSGQIIPAQRQGNIDNGDIIYNVTYENYVTLKGAKKFFVILDNPLQTGSTSAEELVKLKIQTDRLKHITVSPPTVADTPNENDIYAGLVGYNAEENLGILISSGYVFLKQGAYAQTDVFDLKCTYSIDENGKAQLAEYIELEQTELEENEAVESTEKPTIISISARNENEITFETTNGYFQIPDNSTVNFTDPLIITEGQDTWSVLRVMHKDSTDAKLKDILEKRVLMRAIIDGNDSAQDSAYIIGGAMENTPPASFIKANAFVIENLEEDLVLDNEHFPTESVIYIVKSKNDFNVGGFSRIVFNNNNTGFTTDRSFEIWLEKDTGQKDMLLVKNGTVESNALNRGECVRLFFNYQTSQWSVVYLAADNANNTLVTSNDGSIKVSQTGQTFDLSRKFYVLETFVAGYKPYDINNDGKANEGTAQLSNQSSGYLRFFRGEFSTNKGLIAFDYFSDDGIGISFFGSIQLDLRDLSVGNIIMASNYFEQKNTIVKNNSYNKGLKPEDLVVICQNGKLSLFFKTLNNNTTIQIGFRVISRASKYEVKKNQWLQQLPAVTTYPSSGIKFENVDVKAIFKNNALISGTETILKQEL